ncbi:restriction endonuclease subunit S [Hafnia paralvei]|uniref:restriction endonuclease subunit S n=1 Tax=Hafnia paralvei TaxID=546367 RepID=UPI00241EA815|nr:restriction endonuclease subunit S [Hafnia paralvei]
MAKYKAYPEYKDSGVEWLGDVPKHWAICRLKNLATIKNGQDYKSVQVEDGYPVMGSGGQFTFASKYMYDKPSVLLGRKGTIDKPLYINKPFWTVDTMYYTELNEGFDAKYLYYLALTIQFSRYSTNTALPSMTQEHLSNYKFVVPKIESERNKITEFLDHETAKIDNLIEKQQQLIKLLKEKRQAVISHAVTKGLNPDVPMKDSGVEWLGEVPEHWSVTAVKNICHLIDGDRGFNYPNENDFVDNGIPFFSSKNITNFELTTRNLNYISIDKFKSLGRGKLKHNDLIITVRGTIGHMAKFDRAIIGCDTGFINAQMMILRPKVLLTEFVLFVSESLYWKQQLDVSAYGSTVKQLSNEVIGNFKFILPTENEIIDIKKHIDSINKKYSKLIDNALRQIDLMQERRTALISAAVTGKIDVRDWVAPNACEAEVSQEVTA